MDHTGKLRNQYDEVVDPTQPVPVDTIEAQLKVAITETLTYNGKAAAGAVTINSVEQKAIVTVEGDQVASYWGLEKNKVFEAKVDKEAKSGEPRLTSVTETNGSAAVVINDAVKDLELLFESLTTTVKRYVIKVTDTAGGTHYGWILGVAKSTNVYTIDVVNNRVTETQNWVGTLGSFNNASLAKVEIFRYNSSLTFATGTTLTEEVICPREYSKNWYQTIKFASESLTNGQYFVDYMRGRIIGKRADTTASESVTYNVWTSTVTAISSAGSTTPAGFYAEDSAHSSGHVGAFILSRRTDAAASSAGADGDYSAINTDALGHVWVREGYAPGYEDNTAGVAKVEARYGSSGALTADTQVKGSAGFVHTITVSNTDIAATAGTIDVYDSLTATGTKIFSMYVPVSNLFAPFTVTLDVSCATGIYVDFTTVADVAVYVSYR